MKSSLNLYLKGETIAAVATPPGEGGIAVIRISGDEAIEVASRVFSGPVKTYKSHTVHYGNILDADKKVVDSGLIVVMRAPKSYTGEDTVEIHCHGGSLITKKVLAVVLKAGARPANPGEFTFRAFLNKKIDLAQAEAVQQLIHAKNELALESAENQLQGSLSKKVEELQKDLLDIAAILEAWVDFPEEGLEFASMEEVIRQLETVIAKINKLTSTFESGKIIHEGLNLCLAGLPNVGKSSLMNALLKKERAIVTDIPGTTRDLIEDDLRMGNLHFKVFDTAGIRNTEEVVEKEGIKRSFKAIKQADLILLILDLSRDITEEEKELIASCDPLKTLLIWNKHDIAKNSPLAFEGYRAISLSAKSQEGMDVLAEMIHAIIWEKGAPSKEEVVITSIRHKNALQNASTALCSIVNGLENEVSAEFLSSDMRYALKELSSIIGMDITEDILGAIFSKFCVGK